MISNTPAKEYGNAIAESMVMAHLLGRYRSQEEMDKAQFAVDDIPTALDEAIAFFINKGVITKKEFSKLDKAIRKYSFTVAYTDSERLLDALKDDIAEMISTGGTMDDFLETASATFQRLGMDSQSEFHLNTVYRTNMQTALNEGRVAMIKQADPELFPLMEFVAIEDDRTRASHLRLNGFKAPANDPVWNSITPPLGFNCRCTVRPVYVGENAKASSGQPSVDPETMPFVKN